MIRVIVCVIALLGPLFQTTDSISGIIDPCRSSSSTNGGCILICPSGDGDHLSAKNATISVTIRDHSGMPIEGIPANDFWLIDCDPQRNMILCGGTAAINADASTNPLGITTISGAIAAGGCAQGVAVVAQGSVIGCTVSCLTSILVRSPDQNGDLSVNLMDLDYFGFNYPPNEPANDCVDLNGDNQINLSDFGLFSSHYGYAHGCQ